MQSIVYFAGIRARSPEESKLNKIRKLFDAVGLGNVIRKGDLTAIKIHFGESGNDSFINPVLVRPIVECIMSRGAKPFLTDTNTLYGGSRANSVDHLLTATQHGFGRCVSGAPLIIADGLQGEDYLEIEIGQKYFKRVKIAGRDRCCAEHDCTLSFQGPFTSRVWRRY